MISALPKTSTPADSAGAAPPPLGETVAAPAPFDFILALETLAAQSADSQAQTTSAALVECGELLGEEDTLDLDGDEELEEDSLEFLAGLLSMTATRVNPPDAQASAIASAAGSAVDGIDGAGVGAAALAGLLEQDGSADGETQSAPETNPVTAARAPELLGASPRPAAAAEHTVTTHVRDPRWADDFGTRVALMVRAGESQAALQLTPVDLGPVDVNVTIRDSQATIHFGAANAETRSLIEASLPKLREMLAAQGFNLLDASVSQGFTQKGQPEHAGVRRPGVESVGDHEVATVRRLNGLLDLYA